MCDDDGLIRESWAALAGAPGHPSGGAPDPVKVRALARLACRPGVAHALLAAADDAAEGRGKLDEATFAGAVRACCQPTRGKPQYLRMLVAAHREDGAPPPPAEQGEPDDEEVMQACLAKAEEAVGVLTTTHDQLQRQLNQTLEKQKELKNATQTVADPHAFDWLQAQLTRRIKELEVMLKDYEARQKHALEDYDRLRSLAIERVIPQIAAQLAKYNNECEDLQSGSEQMWDELKILCMQMSQKIKKKSETRLGAQAVSLRQQTEAGTNKQGHPVATSDTEYLHALYKEAQQAVKRFQVWVDGVVAKACSNLGGSAHIQFQIAPLKGPTRAVEKAKEDYKGDFSRLCDLVRGSIICRNMEEVLACATAIDGSQGDEAQVVRIKNRLCEEQQAGYRDLNLNVKVAVDTRASADGHVCELQLHLKPLLEIKNREGHQTYQMARQLRIFERENLKYSGELSNRVIEQISRGALREVDVSAHRVGDEDVGDLVRALSSPTCVLEALRMRGCKLTCRLDELLTPDVCQNMGPRLKELDLAINELRGPLPRGLSQFKKLHAARLDNNQLEGPLSKDVLPPMNMLGAKLYLNNNKLSGEIPRELADHRGLVKLWLQNNEFTGPVPPELGQLESLQHLRLAQNRLTGSVPEALGNLTELTILDLEDNDLSGALPKKLSNLAKLQGLSLPRTVTDVGDLARVNSVKQQLEAEKKIPP